MGSNITRTLNYRPNYRTAAALHTPETWFVSGTKALVQIARIRMINNNNVKWQRFPSRLYEDTEGD
jgi:hypothetical protein